MTTTPREKYDAMAVGASAIMSPSPRQPNEEFQSIILEVQRMEAEGLVAITKEHRESESGRRQIDLIIFTRLR